MNVAVLSLLAFLPACSLSWPALPSLNRATPFAGAVVADEPKAAMIGADMLTAGATAADAAVATYFALAVTLPASAGLGGGGVCLGYDAKSNRSEAIDFMPRATAGGGMTVPSAVRGMAIVHDRWGGRISWPRLVTPAEILARNGMPVSRALHQQAGNASTMARLDGDASRIFLSAAGKLYPEGVILRQIDLASILGRIAARGGGEFYTGPLAHRIVDAARHSGYDLSLTDLRNAIPRIVAPVTIALSAQRRYFLAPSPVDGSAIVADLLAMLAYGKFAGQELQHRPHLMAEAQARAYAAYARRLQGNADAANADARAGQLMADFRPDANSAPVGWSIPEKRLPPGAGFSVVDKAGNAVSCAFTMMAPMGSGRILLNTGILAAPPPDGEVASLIPLIVADSVKKQAVITLTASGGRAAAAAAAQVAMSLTAEEYPLDDALYRPRMLADEGGALRLEPDAGDSAAVLRERGHVLVMTPDLGRVDVIFCPTQPALPGGCARLADPRGAGLAVAAQR